METEQEKERREREEVKEMLYILSVPRKRKCVCE